MNKSTNAVYQAKRDAEYDRISNDPEAIVTAMVNYGPMDLVLLDLLAKAFTGNSFAEIEHTIEAAVDAQASCNADLWLEGMREEYR